MSPEGRPRAAAEQSVRGTDAGRQHGGRAREAEGGWRGGGVTRGRRGMAAGGRYGVAAGRAKAPPRAWRCQIQHRSSSAPRPGPCGAAPPVARGFATYVGLGRARSTCLQAGAGQARNAHHAARHVVLADFVGGDWERGGLRPRPQNDPSLWPPRALARGEARRPRLRGPPPAPGTKRGDRPGPARARSGRGPWCPARTAGRGRLAPRESARDATALPRDRIPRDWEARRSLWPRSSAAAQPLSERGRARARSARAPLWGIFRRQSPVLGLARPQDALELALRSRAPVVGSHPSPCARYWSPPLRQRQDAAHYFPFSSPAPPPRPALGRP